MKILVIISLLFLSACDTKQKEDKFFGGISQELNKKYD